MANFQFRPIYDTLENILDNTYPSIEGQVFFATDVNKVFVDVDGHRAAQTQLSSINVLNQNIAEVFQQGVKGFEGQILVGKSGDGYRLFFVDLNSVAHNLTFTAEKLGDLTERASYQGGALSYAGNWGPNRQYFADRLRTSAVKFNGDFYYAVTPHTSGATFAGDAAKWSKFSIQFESVATGLLLAENAVITKQLILGQEGTDQGTIRSANATALNTGAGLFMSNASNGNFRVGDPTGNQMLWNGSTLSVTGAITATSGSFSGSINSTEGNIGGWNLTSQGLNFGTAIQLRSNGEIRVAGNSFFTNILLSPKFTIDGNATGSGKILDTLSGKFSVTADGVLTATDGNFSGTVTANSGEIGGWDIDNNGLIAEIIGQVGDISTSILTPNILRVSFDLGNNILQKSEVTASFIRNVQERQVGSNTFFNTADLLALGSGNARFLGGSHFRLVTSVGNSITANYISQFGANNTTTGWNAGDMIVDLDANTRRFLIKRPNDISREIPGVTFSGGILTIYLAD